MRIFCLSLLAAGIRVCAAQDAAAVPPNLQPPAGQALQFHAHATGDQVYSCDGSAWTLSGPDAKLFDASGREAGSHFAGPTWKWSDGSSVTGRPVANATPDPQSIPWLLVTATGHAGQGRMANISSIQRLHTVGGKPPAAGCDAAHKGNQSRSHYTADYYFFAAK